MDPLITSAQLELRVTPTVFRRVFNDYDTGDENDPAVVQLIEDASSKVRGALANTYDIDALKATNPTFASELRRITLDVAHALCAQRNPTVVPIDGFDVMKQAEVDLKLLREGKTSLESSDDPDPDPDSGSSSSGDDVPSEPTVPACDMFAGLKNFYG